MKKVLLVKGVIGLLLFCIMPLFANGVIIVNSTLRQYYDCLSSQSEITVENQVSVTKTTQEFVNQGFSPQKIKYAYPLPGNASAVKLRWLLNGVWKTAVISATQQDSTNGNGGQEDPNLKKYLGNNKIVFTFKDLVPINSTIAVELTYVQLLPYELGKVVCTVPNDYSLISHKNMKKQEVIFNLQSSRKIENIDLKSHSGADISLNPYRASVRKVVESQPAVKDFIIEYTLNADDLGLFSFSTFIPDSAVPDNHGRGYFVSVVEPDPSDNGKVIKKVFTLIIDRSGSMSGGKMEQARDASAFIVKNLNKGDKFNLIAFDDEIEMFKNEHIEFNDNSKKEALYIQGLNSDGSTNISGAFGKAIPQFATANDSTANIIIFFTDGEATAGITDTDGILKHINNLNSQNESDITIFTFGIGESVNTPLLSHIANQNNGITEFLGADQLEEVITKFYLKIRNPVLLKTTVDFSPNLIDEVYPRPLPNLYKGEQMIIVGRYKNPGIVKASFKGEAFGSPVEYTYNHALTDVSEEKYQFLTKIWAKGKMEYQYKEYIAIGDTSSLEARELKKQIEKICVDYGIVGPFTSFQNGQTVNKHTEKIVLHKESFNILSLSRHKLVLQIVQPLVKDGWIKIYNLKGRLIHKIAISVNSAGEYVVDLRELRRGFSREMCVMRITLGNRVVQKMLMM